MNKTEAIREMKKGVKITHESFTDIEWMTIEGDDLLLEDGVKVNFRWFFKFRTDNCWLTGYSIFNK